VKEAGERGILATLFPLAEYLLLSSYQRNIQLTNREDAKGAKREERR
jgi:hypothetical protein